MRERDIEKRFVLLCKRHGMRVVKMPAGIEIGMPDRLVLFDGFAGFCELKAPGKTPSPAQKVYLKRLKEEGCFTGVIDNPIQIEWFISAFKAHTEKSKINNMKKNRTTLQDRLNKIQNEHFCFNIHTGREEAHKKYEEKQKEEFHLVRLIESNHEYSEGYWVECFLQAESITKLSNRDFVLKSRIKK